MASTTGKIELESVEDGRESKLVEDLIKRAVLNTFGRYFDVTEFDGLVSKFEEGLVVETGTNVPSADYADKLPLMELSDTLRRLDSSKGPAGAASAIEFILEGLHLNRRLNREQVDGGYIYRG